MTIPTGEEIDAAIEADAITFSADMADTIRLAVLVRRSVSLVSLDATSLVAGIKLGLRIAEARAEREQANIDREAAEWRSRTTPEDA